MLLCLWRPVKASPFSDVRFPAAVRLQQPRPGRVFVYLQAIPGVPRIESGYNPATYMLEVSTVSSEEQIGRDLSEVYRESQLCRCGGCMLAADTCCSNRDTSRHRNVRE